MVVSIQGRRLYLWRAVDSEGEMLDLLVRPSRDKAAALKLMRKLLKKQGYAPRMLVTDKLRSYASARRELGCPPATNRGFVPTIEPRIPIRRCDDESARCRATREPSTQDILRWHEAKTA